MIRDYFFILSTKPELRSSEDYTARYCQLMAENNTTESNTVREDWKRTNLSRNPKTKDMKAAIRRAYNILTSGTLYPVLQAELRKPPFPHPNERAAEYAFALRYLKTFGSGPVLDIGPGRSSWPHGTSYKTFLSPVIISIIANSVPCSL